MKEKRLFVLEHVAQGDITVDEAVTLLKVLAAIDALEYCGFASLPTLSIDIYLN